MLLLNLRTLYIYLSALPPTHRGTSTESQYADPLCFSFPRVTVLPDASDSRS